MEKNSKSGAVKEKGLAFETLKKYSMALVLFVILIVCSIITPSFLTGANLTNLIRQISVNGLIAIGMGIVIVNGGIDLAVGGYVAVMSILCVQFQIAGMHYLVAIALVLIIAILIGAFNGLCIHWGMVPFIMTLATQTILFGVAMVLTGGYTVTGAQNAFKWIGQSSVLGIPTPTIIYLIVLVVFSLLLAKTRWGREIYIVGGNPENARLSGINLVGNRILVYALSAVTATLAAIVLASRNMNAAPTYGTGYELDAIAAVVIGGISMQGGEGNVIVTIIGAIFIGVLTNMMNLMQINVWVQQMVTGLVIFTACALDAWFLNKKD